MTLTVVMPPARARLMEAARGLTESRTRTSGWKGEEESAPSGWPMWEWESTRPGISTLPVTSMRWALAGIAEEAGPTVRMRPFSTTTTPFAISGPSMGITRAPVKAIGGDWASAARAAPRSQAIRCMLECIQFRGCYPVELRSAL